MIRDFLWWYGWKIEAVVAFCLDPETPYRTQHQLVLGLVVIFAPVFVAAVLGLYFGRQWDKEKPKPNSNVLDEDTQEKIYKLRVVYMYPPNKEKKHPSAKHPNFAPPRGRFLEELEGKPARFRYSHCYAHHVPFTLHDVCWFIVSDEISRCKGDSGNIELRVVKVQPVPTPENIRKLEEWDGKLTLTGNK